MGLTRGRPGPQMAQYNYFLVVGAQEVENGTVTVRIRSQAKVPSTPTDSQAGESALVQRLGLIPPPPVPRCRASGRRPRAWT